MVKPVVRRILAPVDLAESREPELGYAIGLAAQLRAELLLLAVVDTPATLNLVGHHNQIGPQRAKGGQGRDFEQELQDEVHAKLQQLVDRAAAAGVRALGHLTFAEDVEEQILKEALVERVDLIVVRSQGRTGIMKALLGSTAGEILKAAPCPVLVARA
ncbi:MAG: universal stress protein [Planctomycetes bacterium]|nr:universal stress protein [Planctomycetota bacterium]